MVGSPKEARLCRITFIPPGNKCFRKKKERGEEKDEEGRKWEREGMALVQWEMRGREEGRALVQLEERARGV